MLYKCRDISISENKQRVFSVEADVERKEEKIVH